MSLTDDLVEAMQKALGRKAELMHVQSEQLKKKKEEMRRLIDADKSPDDLHTQCEALEHEVKTLDAEHRRLKVRVEEAKRKLSESLTALWEHLLRLCQEDLAKADQEVMMESFLSAVDAFAPELSELSVDLQTASTAQKEAQLGSLAKRAKRVRASAGTLASAVSRGLEQSAEHLEQRSQLEQERTRLVGQEKEVVEHLRAHAPGGAELPLLARSIADADEKTLASLRRHVLEVVLRDLQAERRHNLAPAVDPLQELRLEMETMRR